MRVATRWLAGALLVIGGLAYADWVLQLVLPVRADLTTSFISELSAAGQPFHDLFRVSDFLGGVLLVVGGGLAWVLTRRHAAVWGPLLLLGVCIMFEAALPLHGSYTFGPALPPPGTGAWWAKISEPHGIASFLETLSYLVLLVTCDRALRRSGASPHRRRLVALVGLVAALSGVLDAFLTAALLLHGVTIGLGLVQRLGVTLTAVWLAAAPVWLLVLSSRRPAKPVAQPPARQAQHSSCSSGGSSG